METLTTILNTREQASLLLIGAFLIFVSKDKKFGTSLKDLVRSALTLHYIFVSMIIYIGIVIAAAYTLGLVTLDIQFLKTCIYWFFGVTLAQLFSIPNTPRAKGYFKKIITQSFGVSVFISFLISMHTFSLVTEIILILTVIILGGTAAVSKDKDGSALVHTATANTLSFIGFIFIILAVKNSITDYKNFFSLKTAYDYLTPVLLTTSFIPYLYVVSWYSELEQKKLREAYKK